MKTINQNSQEPAYGNNKQNLEKIVEHFFKRL